MIIYNKTWLDNLHLNNNAKTLHGAGCITATELNEIKEKYPVGFYTPGLIIRIGLFVLTCITILFSFGLLSLMFSDAHVIDSFGWPIFLGIICVVVLEWMTKEKNYYRAGVDDALLWMSAGFIIGGIWWMLTPKGYGNGHADYLLLSVFTLIVSLCFTLRYAHVLMSVICILSVFAALFFLWIRIGFMGTSTVPFIMMIAGAAIYIQVLNLPGKIKTKNYDHCLTMCQIVSLIVLYAAGNYFITDWANHQLSGIAQSIKLEVTWAPFFWAWTMIIPVVYVIFGLLKKNVVLLRTGLVLFAAAVYTFRTYYHVMSIEVALLLGGVALLAIVYAVIRYLKTPKHGFTYADIDNLENADNLKIEALLTAATFGHKHNAPTQPADRFGGGDFGGGGSGGKF